MKIITAGSYYLDIDAYAGIVAYAELLNKQGIPAQAVSTAPLNESITKSARSWRVNLKTTYTPSPDDTFTLIDVSTPGHYDSFVTEAQIERVIDHHPGNDAYWRERIGEGADIEFVGAACTQVYEYWKRAGLLGRMSHTSARLLACGILDNTLNFGATITTERDHAAYADLMSRADLPADWPARYFGECQAAIDADPVGAMQNDSKMIEFRSLGRTLKVGQLVVWDTAKVLSLHKATLKQALRQGSDEWFINIVSISKNKSYFVCDNPGLQGWLAELLDVQFHDDTAQASRMWLRKEIIKQDHAALEHEKVLH